MGSDRASGIRSEGPALRRLREPLERLLTLGGDSRLAIDRRTRLNRYGCSPAPRPWAITFSSCTATSISYAGWTAAEEERTTLIERGIGERLEAVLAERFASIRGRLRAVLQLGDECEIITGASGTDCELLALALSCSEERGPVRSILLGPAEVGSGTPDAAAGRHFDHTTPVGGVAVKGEAVEGMCSDRIELVPVPVRDAEGRVVPLADLDDQVNSAVLEGLGRGQRVLVHLLDGSKTGLGGPSLGCLENLVRKDPERVWVLADLAQMRTSLERIRHYLDLGFMLIVTGSKFYTGPPFSGALVVPPAVDKTAAGMKSWPRGLRRYFTRADLPEQWAGRDWDLADEANLGLLLRWAAGLAEIEAFAGVPTHAGAAYLRKFLRHTRDGLAGNPNTRPIDAPVRGSDASCSDGEWDELQSILTFQVDPGEGRLNIDEAGYVYEWLNRDIAVLLEGWVKGLERDLAAKQCHIGQPVGIGRGGVEVIGALRIAPGARFVSRVHSDPELGVDPAARIRAQVSDVETVLAKISLICRHWNVLVDVSGFAR